MIEIENGDYDFREKLLYEFYCLFNYLKLSSQPEEYYRKTNFQYLHELIWRIEDYFSVYFNNIIKKLSERGIKVREQIFNPKVDEKAKIEFMDSIKKHIANAEENTRS